MLHILSVAFALICFALASPAAAVEIVNHSPWYDTDGKLIDCHEGGILRLGDTFYWYGRAYKGNVNGIYGADGAQYRCGIHCYTSTNLVNWTHRGEVLGYPASGFLTGGTWHRPRVLYNAATGKYVLWFFMFPNGQPSYFTMVVATAPSPTGPFTVQTGPGFGVSGDLALFQDVDGQGYLAHENNRQVKISRLTPDFLNMTGDPVTALAQGGNHEGSSLIRYKGKYIVAGSGVVGLDPSDTSYAVTDSVMGPYTYKGLMSEAGTNTWRSQISSFFYLAESDRVIVLCEQWLTGPNGERVPGEQSCQLWLPLTFDPATGTARMDHVTRWDPWTVGSVIPPPATQALIGHWKLDEGAGTTAADASGMGNAGTLQNGPAWIDGAQDKAVHFDGLDDRISCATSALPAANAPQTITCWLRVAATPGSPQVAVALGGSSSGVFVGYHNIDGAGIRLGAWRYGGPYLAKTAAPMANQWHHIAYAFDGTTHRLYLDQALVDSSITAAQTLAPSALSLGGLPWGGENFRGDLDEVRIYNYALSAGEIAALAAGSVANQAPSVSLSAPGAGLIAPASIALGATASDSDGTIAKVAFYQGTTKLGEDTAAPYGFTWTGVAAGTYSLTVVATDDDGATTTSAVVSVTVNGSTTSPNLALNRPVTASSVEGASTPATAVNDGSGSTRWSSKFSDPQWISVDLGARYAINRVRLVWEAAYARDFQVEVSDDNAAWTTIASRTGSTGGSSDLIGLAGSGRYIRMLGTQRGTGYGYSLWEFEVYGVATTGGLPAPWVTTDVGGVGQAGSATVVNGTWTVAGSGADIWSNADAFRFVSQMLSGDGQITARVVSQTTTDPWAKAGVMIRENTTAGSRQAMTVVTPGKGLAFQRRLDPNGASSHTAGALAVAPYWVRLSRVGNVFAAYQSTDGSTWQTVGTATIAMGGSTFIGLAVASHHDGVISTAVFDSITIIAAPSGGG